MNPPPRASSPARRVSVRPASRRAVASALVALSLAAAPFVGASCGSDGDEEGGDGGGRQGGGGGAGAGAGQGGGGRAGAGQAGAASSSPGTPTTPAPTTPAPTTPGPSSSMPPGPVPGPPAGPVGELFALVNAARGEARSCGAESFEAVPPLRWDDRLGAAAQAHSADMASGDYFDHVSPGGSRPEDRVRAQGYEFSSLGENIAAGQGTPAAAMATWLGSPDHCSSIMSPNFRDFGAGRAEGGSLNTYWTQVFGKPQ